MAGVEDGAEFGGGVSDATTSITTYRTNFADLAKRHEKRSHEILGEIRDTYGDEAAKAADDYGIERSLVEFYRRLAAREGAAE